MLSSVLRSTRAIFANIAIMRAFVVEYRSVADAAPHLTRSREKGLMLIVFGGPIANQVRRQICDFAREERLPSYAADPVFVIETGCLMSYSVNSADLYRRSAHYVDKIVKGAKPADLPIEQPTKFELVIHRKTANAIAIKIPQSIVLRADRVVD